jgi:delta-aminolevulinic acid dehydratase/porphobilinogen synthase
LFLLYSALQAKHQFEQLREEIRNKNLEEINMLRISLDAQIEDLEQLFETAHLNYLQQTAQRTHDFKELTHKDQILDVDINQKKKKIDNLQVMSDVSVVAFTSDIGCSGCIAGRCRKHSVHSA